MNTLAKHCALSLSRRPTRLLVHDMDESAWKMSSPCLGYIARLCLFVGPHVHCCASVMDDGREMVLFPTPILADAP